jgi:hypothetical protein
MQLFLLHYLELQFYEVIDVINYVLYLLHQIVLVFTTLQDAMHYFYVDKSLLLENLLSALIRQ